MSILKRFLSFWYNFIVGDDWVLAVGVIVGLGVTALVTHSNTYWWILPVFIIGSLVVSLLKAIRAHD